MTATLPIAFNTANLVGRVTGYRFQLSRWMDQQARTIQATDETAWKAICREIAAAGYTAVEVWEAHAAPETLTRERAAAWLKILEDYGLQAIGYAGGLRRETLQVCQWLGISCINGGLGQCTPAAAAELCREFGVTFNFENHPEKSPDEILAGVDGGSEHLGVCLDTGWLGTQGVDAPAAVQRCGRHVRHVHLKDVKAPGKHETCLLGSGVVDLTGCIRALREIGYAGWYSWEDEPEDRNPFDSAARNREWIEQHLA